MLGKLPLSEFQGPRDDFEQKLAGDDGEIWLSEFKRFLRKEPTWRELSFVLVDRTILPKYPDWVKEVLYPELESVGPAEFDAGKLELWLHDRQKNGMVTGNVIHSYLKNHDMLKECLGLRDLEEIQKKGIFFFRKHFKGKCVFGWKSVILDRHDILCSPCLYEEVGNVCFFWCWLINNRGSDNPALRFAS